VFKKTFYFVLPVTLVLASCKFGEKKVLSDESSVLLSQRGVGVLLTPHILNNYEEVGNAEERVCAYEVSDADTTKPNIRGVNKKSLDFKEFLEQIANNKNDFNDVFPWLGKAVLTFRQKISYWFAVKVEAWSSKFEKSAAELKKTTIYQDTFDKTLDLFLTEVRQYSVCLDTNGQSVDSQERQQKCTALLSRDLKIGLSQLVVKALPTVKQKVWNEAKLQMEVADLVSSIKKFEVLDSNKSVYSQIVVSKKKTSLLMDLVREMESKLVSDDLKEAVVNKKATAELPACPNEFAVQQKYFSKSSKQNAP
jgi:hypothetical protein